MKLRIPRITTRAFWSIVVVAAAAASLSSWNHWFPATATWVRQTIDAQRTHEGNPRKRGVAHLTTKGAHSHSGHVHAHGDTASLELSEQALRNIGLSPEQIRPIQLQTFHKSIMVPARIVERPGRTRVQVATPMTGVITHVHAVQGEAVQSGTLLFRIRLTHEDLVQAQTNFLRTLGELDVEEREIRRLSGVTQSGAVAGKLLLDRQYAKDKLTALLGAQQEALRLHGLSEQQVERIARDRRLLRELQVFAPTPDEHPEDELRLSSRPLQQIAFSRKRDRHDKAHSHRNQGDPVVPLILHELRVHKGQSVNAGETLCVLSDFSELYVEGLAFEQDIDHLRQTSLRSWKVTAVFDQPDASARIVNGLDLAYLANHVDTVSRTLHFYVRLPNTVTADRSSDGNRYVEWKFVPGQRLQLRVPIEEWTGRIVLPVEAVAREGAEYYVFQQNGKRFNRVPVHVKYRDQRSMVIADDGSLVAGDVIAMRGAHQMQMAVKHRAGGGAHLHAGHVH